jgi:catalase
MGQAMATGADNDVTTNPQDLGGPERVTRTLANMQANVGYAPGFRRAHARGVAFRGSFTASPEAAALTTAPHMQGDAIPLVVRFSNGAGNPRSPDKTSDRKGAVMGLAVRFELPGGGTAEWAALNIPDFPAHVPDDFNALAAAQKKNRKGKPNPLRIALFVLTHHRAFRGLKAILGVVTAESFATQAYNGLHAYFLVDGAGERRAFRYRWVPLAGVHGITPAEDRLLPAQFLVSEIKERVARLRVDGGRPVAWDLVFQLAEPGDPTDDMTKHWPETRTLVTAGRLIVDALHSDQDKVDRSMFDPTLVPAGIEVSDDPVLHFRSEIYIESQKRRLAETKPVT